MTEHSTGTGTTSPLGITRCTLWIQAGTSTTPGKRLARLYRPDLNGCGSSSCPRVPSGNRISESPLSSALMSGCKGSSSPFLSRSTYTALNTSVVIQRLKFDAVQ
ncbi:hypothetical protein D9M69_693390 [compost metagenome]